MIFRLSSIVLLVLYSASTLASSSRPLWVASARPAEELCRMDLDEHFAPLKKADSAPGQHFEYSAGFGCKLLENSYIQIEGGADYVESSDVLATSITDPLQGFVKFVLPSSEESVFHVALAVDGFGLKSGTNNYDIITLILQNRLGPWEISLGAYRGNSAVLVASDGSAAGSGVQLALWKVMGAGGFGAEFSSGKNKMGYIFAGAQAQLGDTIKGSLGYGLANDQSGMRDWVLLRLTLN